MHRQKNSWPVFGAGKAQSALYKAVSKKRIDLFFRDLLACCRYNALVSASRSGARGGS
jgi:hypothetical protein